MADIFEQVTNSQMGLEKLLRKIPGIGGYLDREDRRRSDKVVRETIVQRYEEQARRLSELQTNLVNEGMIDLVDDVERAHTKLRIFIDGVQTASYGMSSVFDTVRIDEEALTQLYQYDLAMLNGVEALSTAIDNANASFASDGMPASIRNIVAVSQDAVTAFDRRKDVILGIQ